jgi:hypothetical protein
MGLLEKLGVGGPSWEQEERERFRQTMVPVENQLAAGQASPQEQQRRIAPATSRRFEVEDDYDYVEVEQRREREPLRQRRYLDDERDPGPEAGLRQPGAGEERFAPERRPLERDWLDDEPRDRFASPRDDEPRDMPRRMDASRFEERPVRRYVRDEGPLDVEPLDNQQGGSDRRNRGADPW